MHRDTVTRSWGPLLCHSSTTITSCCSMIPCCKDLYTIPGSWNHPSSCMASILTGHVTNWACLGCSGSAYTTACSSSCQYPATMLELRNRWFIQSSLPSSLDFCFFFINPPPKKHICSLSLTSPCLASICSEQCLKYCITSTSCKRLFDFL